MVARLVAELPEASGEPVEGCAAVHLEPGVAKEQARPHQEEYRDRLAGAWTISFINGREVECILKLYHEISPR